MEKDSSEVQSVTRTRQLAEVAGRKIRPGLRWMAVAAFLALGPVGGSMAAGTSDVPSQIQAQVVTQQDSSPGETLHVRKSGGDQQEYLAMRKAGGEKEIIAVL